LVLAPTGFTRIAHPAGELAVARAAERAQLPYTLSTLSTRSIEEVAKASSGRLWFQEYVWRDRGLTKELIDRAAGAGYEALCLTLIPPS
jgi:L-lactate dehydrogenase (cytochrome)